MRVAVVNSFYRSSEPSGENLVVESEVKALQNIGLDVRLFDARTDDEKGNLLFPLRAAVRVATGRGRSPLKAIREFRPDIVHIHNLFPNFSRRWVAGLSVPLVHTLHNYRPLCANALLFRDGHLCTECLEGNRWSGVRHACYKSSRLATIPIALAYRHGPVEDPVIRRAERLVVMSKRQYQTYVASGVPANKIVLGPPFLPDELDSGPSYDHERNGWLFVGRLSQEKGILKLVERWPHNHLLRIVGDGEQRAAVQTAARGKHIEMLGKVNRSKVLELMKASRGLVFPSLAYETFGLVFLEALAAGLPTLAFEPNVAHDLVRDYGVGWTATWEDDLPSRVSKIDREIELNDRAIRTKCRDTFELFGSERSYVERTQALYRSLIQDSINHGKA